MWIPSKHFAVIQHLEMLDSNAIIAKNEENMILLRAFRNLNYSNRLGKAYKK